MFDRCCVGLLSVVAAAAAGRIARPAWPAAAIALAAAAGASALAAAVSVVSRVLAHVFTSARRPGTESGPWARTLLLRWPLRCSQTRSDACRLFALRSLSTLRPFMARP